MTPAVDSQCLQPPLGDRMIMSEIETRSGTRSVISRQHVHTARHSALDRADEARIARQLDGVFGLGPPPQLGVGGFVAPGTEARCLLNSFEKVGVAEPGWGQKSRLIDHIGPGLHYLPSECASLGNIEPFGSNLDDREALRFERGEVSPFVLDAFLEDQDGRGVALGDLHGFGQISQIKVGGVSAAEKIHEVRGRQQRRPSRICIANYRTGLKARLRCKLSDAQSEAIYHVLTQIDVSCVLASPDTRSYGRFHILADRPHSHSASG